jgi:hypothetical protein
MEITQIKGDGETHPFLSPEDEFADFERWDVGNITGSAAKTPEMLRYEYARSALLVGLEVEAAVGVNPYDFGFNGTTDSHTGLASSGEENFFGKFAGTEPGPDRFDKNVVPNADPSQRIVSAQESACRPHRRLGTREHPRRDLRRHAAQGNLRHHRNAPYRAALCGLGLRAG